MRIAIKKWLANLGFAYCSDCGGDLWFDKERFGKGYGARFICLKCDDLDRFEIKK